LNAEQKVAVEESGNTAVLAGPGSGKTATLVIKVAHLLSRVIQPPAGVACITYNDDAVREFRNRLCEFGIYAGKHLFLGTVHSFCLNCVLRPYAGLVNPRYKDGVVVAGPRHAEILLAKALSQHVPEARVEYYGSNITRLRRAQFCGEDTSGFDDRDFQVVIDYDRLLADERLVDFEGMLGLALELIRSHAWIRDLLAARFPWLIVDEYQDLGGPLHAIVTTLIDRADMNVFAVGDPDQTIYDFTGANPRYLQTLAQRDDFRAIRLKFNYRSGRKLIAASQAALPPEQPRDYQADPERLDQGEIFLVQARDHIEDHAAKAVEAVRQAIENGTRPEEIAVFYRQKTVLLADLRCKLEAAGIEYIAERASQYPSSPATRWLQDAASYAFGTSFSGAGGFEELYRFYRTAAESAGYIDLSADPLELRVRLYETLTSPLAEGLLLGAWLHHLDEKLSLRQIIADAGDRSDDAETLEELSSATRQEGPLADTTLVNFATDGRVQGKVVLTTFHSSKGRQFDVVVIPGLAEGIMPPWRWSRGQYHPPGGKVLGEARRLFYVGFTRARDSVHLIYSGAYVQKGYLVSLGVSRFVKEIMAKLDEM
jgi:DNA helicase-2/ATP-dependent DNA helicase PcrA